MSHTFALRVYYEDTDLAGIVYYANYLKFIERARTEWVRDLGIDQRQLRNAAGIVFAVRRIEADYLRAAKFDDTVVVHTRLIAMTGARIMLDQQIFRADEKLFAAVVTLVCLTDGGHPARLPAEVRLRLDPAPQ
jgi:acyl-CoA thioester hydrolase